MTTITRNGRGEVRVDGGPVEMRLTPNVTMLAALGTPGGITRRFVPGTDGVMEWNPDVQLLPKLDSGVDPVPISMCRGGNTISYYASKWSIARVARALIAVDRRSDVLGARWNRIADDVHRLGRAAKPVPFEIGKNPLPVPAPNWMTLEPYTRDTPDGPERGYMYGRWNGAPIQLRDGLYDPEAGGVERGAPYPNPTAEEWAVGYASCRNESARARLNRAKGYFEAYFVRAQQAQLNTLGPVPREGTSKRLEVHALGGGTVVAWWRAQRMACSERREWFMFIPLEIVR